MYANMRVAVIGPDNSTEHLYAWDIDITSDTVVVYLDANDGDGNYAVEDGTKIIPREGNLINVQADF